MLFETSTEMIVRMLMQTVLWLWLADSMQAIPVISQPIHSETSFEQCYFHLNVNHLNQHHQQQQTTSQPYRSILYGQCMSKNGPDGCCLEGHYRPGICSNLGHICCTKPDPECNAMRYNKGITKSNLKQYGKMFMELNSNVNHNRAIRSNKFASGSSISQYRYQTNFEIIEMPARMQLDPVTIVINALDRYNGDFDSTADYLCRMLDQKYQEHNPWACTVGKDFGYSVEPEPGKYMLFYVGQDVRVMAFVTANTKTTTTTIIDHS